ncbi:RNA-directed DNA polymerase, eukaryota, reverse transcriptase zinc-binding domain protein [Tanacetum coccineum]
MVSDALNDLNAMVKVDEDRNLGNSNVVKEKGGNENMNGGRMDENRCENQVEQVCEVEEMGINSSKNNNEKRGDNYENLNGNWYNNGSTYAKMVTKDLKLDDNKLDFVPTELNEEGDGIVIFDEALVDKGSSQWKLIVCGHFVGYKMSVHELRNEEGMNKVLALGPWIVNNKPLFLKKYDPTIGMERAEQKRVLVEFDVMKGFKEKIEIQYRDKNNNKKVMEAKRKEEIIRKRNEENRERNNAGNYIGYRKNGDKRQNKEGRFFNAGAKMNEAKGGKNKEVGEGVSNANKFAALNDMEEENDDLKNLKGRMIVDAFLNKKVQPNCIEVKNWTQDMIKYYKNQWEINRQKETEEINEDIEDVLEGNSGIVTKMSIEEMEGWDWVSNSVHNTSGCRIMIGWDKNKVDIMVVHMTRKVMLVVVEIIKLKQKVFCSFVYASNSGIERRSLWNKLRSFKNITSGYLWILMGDFNVTLKLEEHSVGGSRITSDMHDFEDCVNDIEVKDVNSTGLFFT